MDFFVIQIGCIIGMIIGLLMGNYGVGSILKILFFILTIILSLFSIGLTISNGTYYKAIFDALFLLCFIVVCLLANRFIEKKLYDL